MELKELGKAAVGSGWRETLADRIAPRLGASRAPLSAEQARAALGLVFLGLSLYFVAGTLRRYRRQGSG